MNKQLMYEILDLATEDRFFFWELMPEQLKKRGLISTDSDLLDALFDLQEQGYICLYGGDSELAPVMMNREDVGIIEPHDSEKHQCFAATEKGRDLCFSGYFDDLFPAES